MKIDYQKAVIAGVVGTLLMTLMGLYVAPLMDLPAMNPAKMLAGKMGDVIALGWIAHFMIGVVLVAGYAFVAKYLWGDGWLRGATYSLAPWAVSQFIMMPMMGMPLFANKTELAVGSLIGHLVYGIAVGLIYPASKK
jgi:uncharacterized membrane protein YagU involved in acid resistance